MLRRVIVWLRGLVRRPPMLSGPAGPDHFKVVLQRPDGSREPRYSGRNEAAAKAAWAALQRERPDGHARFTKNGRCRGTYHGAA